MKYKLSLLAWQSLNKRHLEIDECGCWKSLLQTLFSYSVIWNIAKCKEIRFIYFHSTNWNKIRYLARGCHNLIEPQRFNLNSVMFICQRDLSYTHLLCRLYSGTWRIVTLTVNIVRNRLKGMKWNLPKLVVVKS